MRRLSVSTQTIRISKKKAMLYRMACAELLIFLSRLLISFFPLINVDPTKMHNKGCISPPN